MIEFNINDYIRVKLTDHGRECHRKAHDELIERIRQPMAKLSAYAASELFKYTPPKEDADGWSKWQAWDFMATFGQFLQLGGENVISTNIQIVVREDKPIII